MIKMSLFRCWTSPPVLLSQTTPSVLLPMAVHRCHAMIITMVIILTLMIMIVKILMVMIKAIKCLPTGAMMIMMVIIMIWW